PPQVRALVHAPGAHQLAPCLDLDLVAVAALVHERIEAGAFGFLHHGFLEADVHPLGIDAFLVSELEQGAQHVRADLRRPRLPGDPEAVAAARDVHVQAAFDLSKALVELAAEIGQPLVVGGFQDDVLGDFDSVQWAVTEPRWAAGRALPASLTRSRGTWNSRTRPHPAARKGASGARRRPRREFGSASVITTSTNRPRQESSPSKLTQRLFSVRPVHCRSLFFERFSTSTRW